MVVLVMSDWRKVALRGMAAMLFGVVTLAWPGLTLAALVVLFGAYVFVDGLCTLAAVLADEPETRGHRRWLLLEGTISVLAGLATFAWPHITALALLYVIAVWAAGTGTLELVTATRLRHQIRHGWLLAIIGLLSIAFAVLLVANPGAGALATTWLIGWYALVAGALTMGLATELRRVESASGRGRIPPTREATA